MTTKDDTWHDAFQYLPRPKRPHPNIAWFRDSKYLPQPTGKPPSVLIPMVPLYIASLAIMHTGAVGFIFGSITCGLICGLAYLLAQSDPRVHTA